MDEIGHEGMDFWHRIQELEEQEQEQEVDDFFFKGIVDTRVKSKARRKAIFKIYFGDRNGTTENFGDC
jgi:hypothetical protein